MQMALKARMENFPDSILLKEWYEKNDELFSEVENEGSGGMKDKEHGFEVLAKAMEITHEAVLNSYRREKKKGKEILETVAVNREYKTRNVGKEIAESVEDVDNGKRGKGGQKLDVYGKSPFVERIVRIGDKKVE